MVPEFKREMVLKVLVVLIFMMMSNSMYGRRPAIIGNARTAEDVYCSYQNSLIDPGANKEDFIALFENYFNLGQIKDVVLKEKIFCVLYDFYLINDLVYAEEFRSRMSHVDCP